MLFSLDCHESLGAYDCSFGRLQQEMDQWSLKQCQAHVAADMRAMSAWASDAQEALNREGHLDVKFLQARYQKGVNRVGELMAERHRYIECDGLRSAQPEILRFMAGPDAAQGIPSLIFNSCRKHS